MNGPLRKFIFSLKAVLDLKGKNVARPKGGKSWLCQLRQYFCLKFVSVFKILLFSGLSFFSLTS